MKSQTAFFIALLWLTSCAPVYVPNTINAPQLTDQGELSGTVTTGVSGLDVQLSYAVSDNFGVMVNTSFDFGDTSETNYHEHAFGEVGFGYLTKFGELGTMNIFGGYGLGSSAASDEYTFITDQLKHARGLYHRMFVQSDVGIKSNVFEGGIGFRTAYVSFYQVRGEADDYSLSEDNLFLEPIVYLRVGAPNVKVHSQLGFSASLFSDYAFDYVPFIFNIGLTFRLNTMGLQE